MKCRGRAEVLYLHRVIARRMGILRDGLEVDHINGNPLDNRRENLRAVSRSLNLLNMKIPVHNRSGKRGIGFHAGRQQWRARYMVQRREVHLGWFDSREDAERAYDKATEGIIP